MFKKSKRNTIKGVLSTFEDSDRMIIEVETEDGVEHISLKDFFNDFNGEQVSISVSYDEKIL